MKRLMAIVLIVAMLGMIVPMFSVSADLPCMGYPIFEVLVEGKTSWEDFVPDENPIKFKELTYGKGSTFTVEVWLRGIEDMFAYEFTLTWGGAKYWLLSAYTVEDVWPAQAVIKPDLDFDLNKLGLPTTTSYEQVVSALPPSTGVSGDIKLATLTFYIHTDIAYHEPIFKTKFEIEGKVSDSCSMEIELCDPHYALVKFYPAEPDIEMRPNMEINSAAGPHEKFTKEIWVSDITKMKSLTFDLRWTKNVVVHCGQVQFHSMVELHVVAFDSEATAHYEILEVSDVIDYGDEEGIIVDFKLKCTATPLRGTFRFMTLTFVKLDPWPCGKQPDYEYSQMHEWTPDNAYCLFYFYKGWFDVLCPDLAYIYFGAVFNPPLGITETEGYGEADWDAPTTECMSHSGGGSILLETHMNGDFASVRVTPSGLFAGNITKLTFCYYTEGGPGAGWNLFSGPRMAVGLNSTAAGPSWLAVSADAGASWPWSTFDATAGQWWVFSWTYGDWTSIAPVAGPVAWGFAAASDIVTHIAVYVGVPDGVNVGTGSAVVDCIKVEGNLNNPYTIDTKTYDLEPPCQTSKWYDADLYADLQVKISNLYIFAPLPGDLNRDGCVDIIDVMIIASMYGQTTYPAIPFYDFSVPPDGDVDIFDVVVVTKHFGLACP